MKPLSVALLVGVFLCGPASARMKLNTTSGQEPQTLTAEPSPGMRMARFQVFYIDDHSCPAGQIKKFTAGSKSKGIPATRECVAH